MNPEKKIDQGNKTPADFIQSIAGIFTQFSTHSIMLNTNEFGKLLYDEGRLKLWLADEELARLSSFKMNKRRSEWLAGRLCTKIAVANHIQSITQISYSEIIVRNSKSGRPFITLPGCYSRIGLVNISISHSSDFAIAMAADGFCGVDVQEAKSALSRVKERFCSTNDSRILNSCLSSLEPIHILNVLWAAKESVRKACSHQYIPEFLDIHLQEIRVCAKPSYYTLTFLVNSKTITAVSGFYNDYALSACLLKDY